MLREFLPESYFTLSSGYRLSQLKKDLLAGITVGIIALPLAMAFAISSGTFPEQGLFTAIVAGFLISAFGGSRVQIGGPTGAFVVLIYDIMQRTGYEGLALSTLIASFLLIGFGLLKLGNFIRYIPLSLITGFTTGIAVIIFSSQINDLFGFGLKEMPVHLFAKWICYIKAFSSTHLPTLALGGGTLCFILVVKHRFSKFPWGLGAILFASFLFYFFDLQIETIHSKFGQIPTQLPFPSLPKFPMLEGKIIEIFKDAFAIALLGGIESLLSAVIADRMTGECHRPNCELIAQGIGNFGALLFGGIPATGAIARTAANIKNGGQTPFAGMIHALTLLAILIFFAPFVSEIPLAALSAILVVVAWNMSEIDHFLSFLKGSFEERFLLLIGFFLTIFVDITSAIFVGVVFSQALSMYRKRRADGKNF